MSAPFDRRTALKQAALAGAVLASPAAARAARWAGNQFRVAVMGVNGRGAGLAAAFAAQPDVTLACLCEVDAEAAARAQEKLTSQVSSPPAIEVDVRRVVDDPNIDVLVIAAPDHWHAPATILACAAGKHVYVEKPACHNGREGELMVEAARKHSRVVQLGSQRRSAPGTIEAVQRVRAGEIGRTLFARGWITSTRPSIGHAQAKAPPAHLNYELWQGPAPERPYRENVVHYHWHWFWDWGTGELGNNGIHALDVCRWGLGVDYPRRIVCGGAKLSFNDDQETPDTQLATFHFGDESRTETVIQWEHRTWNQRGLDGDSFGVVFYGEAGTLVMTHGEYAIYDRDGQQLSTHASPYDDGGHIRNFLDAIRGEATLNAEIEQGVISTALCHLGNIAYRTGRTVHFDPAKREIIGDAEAASLWSREYRPGWEPTA